MKTFPPPLDLDAIAHRIAIAREVFGPDFNLGVVGFESGDLTPRPTVDVLRDQDRVALFREVRRLRVVTKDLELATQLVREAVALFCDPETKVDLREWTKTARQLLKGTTTPTDDDDLAARIESTGDPQDSRPASKGGVA